MRVFVLLLILMVQGCKGDAWMQTEWRNISWQLDGISLRYSVPQPERTIIDPRNSDKPVFGLNNTILISEYGYFIDLDVSNVRIRHQLVSFKDKNKSFQTNVEEDFSHPEFIFSNYSLGGVKGIKMVNERETFFGFAYQVSSENYLAVIIYLRDEARAMEASPFKEKSLPLLDKMISSIEVKGSLRIE